MISGGMKTAADSLFRVCSCAQEIRLGVDAAVDPMQGSGDIKIREVCEGLYFAAVEATFYRGHTIELSIAPDEMMILCVMNGRMHLKSSFLPEWDVGEGSVIYSSSERKGTIHAELRANPGDRFSLAMISISLAAWHRLCGEGDEAEFLHVNASAPLVSAYIPETEALFREMCYMRLQNAESERIVLLADALRAMAYIFNSAFYDDEPSGTDALLLLVKNLPKRMMRDLSKPPTIPEMAEELGISPTKLKTLFKQIHGTSIYAMFRRNKLELAGELLDTTASSIRDIAFQCGYQSQGQFADAFSGYFGMTPSEYRQRGEDK